MAPETQKRVASVRGSLRRSAGVEPDTRRASRPTELGALLEEVQSETARLSGAAITPSEWQAAVGERIAQRTRVGRLVRGTLTIYAASAAWANELTFLAHDIVTRLKNSGLDVRNVRFRIKDLGPPPRTSGARVSTRPAQRCELPESLKERLALVDDPKLRAAIAEAAELSLAGYGRPTK